MNTLAVSLVSILAVGSSAFLSYWRPQLFTWSATIPATLVYYGSFAALFALPRVIQERRLPERGSQVLEVLGARASRTPDWVAELFFGLVFTVVGVIIGMVSGTTWWVAGGYEVRSLAEALKIGAILGGAVILLVFGA